MIFGPAYPQSDSTSSTDDPADVIVQPRLIVQLDQWATIFRREDEVVQQIREGLRHCEVLYSL